MDVLNIDTIGPLDDSEDCCKLILLIIDCFTRWVELYPLPDTSTLATADAQIQHVGRFGALSTIDPTEGLNS